jgi:ribosomal protein S12 methylthiotransferase accessory factor
MLQFSDRFLEVYDALVNPRFGLIRRVVDLPLQPDEPDLFIAAATCVAPDYFRANQVPSGTGYRITANGVGFTREECLWSVMGEACERYASAIYFEDDLITASLAELGQQALNLRDFVLYAPDQYASPGFPCRPLDEHTPLRWTEGRSLVDGRVLYVPAFLAWMGYRPELPGEFILPQISTGQGAGGSLAQAILAGLNEVIERDCFSSMWLLASAPWQLTAASLAGQVPVAILELLDHPGLNTRVFDITTDLGVPCYVAVLKPATRDTVALGASANLDPVAALSKAVMEAHHTRNWTLDLERRQPEVASEDITDFEHHVLYYLYPANFSKLAFLSQARARCFAPPTPGRLVDERLEATVQALSDAGYEPVYVDTTPDDLRSIGIHTVKVLVPGLQPLHVGVGTEHRDPRRLRRVAEHWGLSWPRALNLDPHPFP